MAAHLQLDVGPHTFDAVAWGPDDGEPVLLLHGFPQCSWVWRFVQPPLADAGFRSVAPDLRGYSPGARPLGVEDYRMEVLVDDVLGLADRLGWDRFHLVGHDWGGTLAWHVAGASPDRVRTLSVVSTPHPRALAAARAAGASADGDDQVARSSYVDAFRADGAEDMLLADGGAVFRAGLEAFGLGADDAARYVDRIDGRAAATGMLQWYRAAQPGDAGAVGPITVPTLYVYPDADPALGPTAATGTAAEVEGPYRYEELAGIGHWAPEQAPELLVPLLLEHLTDAAS